MAHPPKLARRAASIGAEGGGSSRGSSSGSRVAAVMPLSPTSMARRQPTAPMRAVPATAPAKFDAGTTSSAQDGCGAPASSTADPTSSFGKRITPAAPVPCCAKARSVARKATRRALPEPSSASAPGSSASSSSEGPSRGPAPLPPSLPDARMASQAGDSGIAATAMASRVAGSTAPDATCSRHAADTAAAGAGAPTREAFEAPVATEIGLSAAPAGSSRGVASAMRMPTATLGAKRASTVPRLSESTVSEM
mmetsp:Transcript_21866/g.71383  ORF Transcript_21866/g.71383 Transcript_21866/m.71383 type:complete len:252 (-) Transcript_21866:393-1148(-)